MINNVNLYTPLYLYVYVHIDKAPLAKFEKLVYVGYIIYVLQRHTLNAEDSAPSLLVDTFRETGLKGIKARTW